VRDEILVKTGKHFLAIPKKYKPWIRTRRSDLCQKKDDPVRVANGWITLDWYSPLFYEIPSMKFILKELKEDDVDLFEYTVRRLKKEDRYINNLNKEYGLKLYPRKLDSIFQGSTYLGNIINSDITLQIHCSEYSRTSGITCKGYSKILDGIQLVTQFSKILPSKENRQGFSNQNIDRSIKAWAERHRLIYDRILKWKKRAQEIMDAEPHLKQITNK